MLLRGVSGQYLPFTLVNISGNLQTLASGAISGTKLLDSNPRALLSGNIVETSGGSYRANLYGEDVSGNAIHYQFTASGCVPVAFTVYTIDSTSGHLWPASGANVVVPAASVSGVTVTVVNANVSGINVTVPVASISGVNAIADVRRWSGSIIAASVSGVVSGVPFVDIGYSLGQSVTNVDGTLASGNATTIQFPSTLTDGTSVVDDSRYDYKEVIFVDGTGGGQRILLTSGQSGNGRIYRVFSGSMPVAPDDTTRFIVGGTWMANALSGMSVNATATVNSGSLYLASGSLFRNTFASGVIGASGGFPTAWGNSGQTFPASGVTQIASGPFVVAGIASGTSVIATIYSGQLSGFLMTAASGVNAIVPPSTLSGMFGTASLNSGQSVLVYSGQLSGQPGGALSGQTWLAPLSIGSGQFMSGVLSKLIPQSVLTYDFSGAPDVSGLHNLLQANRKLRNHWDVDMTFSGYLSVFLEDGVTLAYRQALTATSGAQPVTALGN